MSKKIRNFINYLYIFITCAFPKAGITIGGTAITLQMLLLLFVVVINFNYVLKNKEYRKKEFKLWILLTVSLLIVIFANLITMNSFKFLATMIMILSPFSIFCLPELDHKKIIKIFCISSIIVGGYSVVQYIWGIERTAIYGLTITYGVSYTDKTIGLDFANDTALKMPSTYQNGNGSGLFLVLALILILYIFINYRKKYNSFLLISSLICCALGIILCGSRSVVYSLIIASFLVLVWYAFSSFSYEKKINKKVLFSVAIITSLVLVVLVYNVTYETKIYQRIVSVFLERTHNDLTASGRTLQFKNLMQMFADSRGALEYFRNIIFGFDWHVDNSGEGFYVILKYYGLPIMFVFYCFLLTCLVKLSKKSKLLTIGLLALIIDFLVDSTFFYLPYLCLFFIFYKSEMRLLDCYSRNLNYEKFKS